MPRPKRQEDQPFSDRSHNDRWMISYADFITLLFAFFVVMYSVSSVNEGKYRVLSESLDAAFRTANRSMKPIQVGPVKRERRSGVVNVQMPGLVKIGLANLPRARFSEDSEDRNRSASVYRHRSARSAIRRVSLLIRKAMSPLISQGLVGINRNENWVEVEINSSILFSSGSARLARQAIPVLKKIAGIVKPLKTSIHVEGFTDNVPIRNLHFPSNWELSAARAASVVHLFTRVGVAPKRMAAVGYGEYHPVASNKTAKGRRRNRRVVLIISTATNPRFFKRLPAMSDNQVTDRKVDRPTGSKRSPSFTNRKTRSSESARQPVQQPEKAVKNNSGGDPPVFRPIDVPVRLPKPK